MRGSKVAVAQAISEIAAITRTASCRVEHLALDVIDLLGGFEAFGEPASALAGSPEREQEQEHRGGDGAVAQGHPNPRGGGDPRPPLPGIDEGADRHGKARERRSDEQPARVSR